MAQPITQVLESNMTLDAASIPPLPPNIHQDLTQVFTTLQSSLYLLYLHYKPYAMQYENYFKLGVLTILVYVFYKLGGMTVTDRVESEKEQLRKFIQRKNFVQQKVPMEIKKINSNTIKIIVFVLLLAAAYTYAFYTGHQQKLSEFHIPIAFSSLIIICYLIYINIFKLILSSRLKQIAKLNLSYSQKLNHFMTSLGPKVIAILRNHLCRDVMLKFSSSKNLNECNKQECKEFRTLWKQKNDAIASLVEETVDFEWCSTCKRKLPFNEHLHFESMPYQSKSQNQSQQIRHKLSYMVEGLDRMRRWLGQTSPCNCSKLYWTTSTKQILQFKKSEKAIDARLKQSTSMKKID